VAVTLYADLLAEVGSEGLVILGLLFKIEPRNYIMGLSCRTKVVMSVVCGATSPNLYKSS